MTIKQKIEDNITIDSNECWIWLRFKDRDGYGRIKVNGKRQAIHRLSYETYVGPIPEGLQLDHLCRVRHCINPDHLEPVTNAENSRRGNTGKVNNHQAIKTHCPQGHEYNEENTYRWKNQRCCRTCRRIKAYYHRTKKLKCIQNNAGLTLGEQ